MGAASEERERACRDRKREGAASRRSRHEHRQFVHIRGSSTTRVLFGKRHRGEVEQFRAPIVASPSHEQRFIREKRYAVSSPVNGGSDAKVCVQAGLGGCRAARRGGALLKSSV
jgi:hypothetical protein